MFHQGKVLKVKVELAPNTLGFGRATIVDTGGGGRIFLRLKTNKGEKHILPKGTRLWLVSSAIGNPFNGLWSTTIIGAKLVGGKTVFECSRPVFEAELQKRKQHRMAASCPVMLHGEQLDVIKASLRNLSSSGAGIEAPTDCLNVFVAGHYLDATINSPLGPITFTARIINPRYNWLSHKTEFGFEFVKMEPEAEALLKNFLAYLGGGQAHSLPPGKEEAQLHQKRLLANWLKSTKDNINFIRGQRLPANDISTGALKPLELKEEEQHADSQAGNNGESK